MCSPPQGLRHSSPPSTGNQDDLLEPGESTSLKPVRSLTLALLLLSALGGCALPSARDVTLETSLREEIHTVRVAEADATIVVTTFRPSGAGPFPWIVLSHGTAPTAAANRALGRYRPLAPVREWVHRGYAVVAPVRRGYGASGGDKFGDSYGACAHPGFPSRRRGRGAGPARHRRMGKGAARSGRQTMAARRPERRRVRLDLHRLEA